MAGVMTVEQRTQLMAFLVEISKADGKVTDDEIDALRMIAVSMNLNIDIVNQLLNLGGSSLDEAYKVLGITPDVSDEEVRRAYKKMVLQHHPDRVATLGDDIKAAAEKKFKEIVDAKDRIFEARGMK
jgi:DnaJ like chaperone protein